MRAFIILLVFAVLPGMALLVHKWPQVFPCRSTGTAGAEIREGPWGRLEINDLAIAPADVIVPDQIPPVKWLFSDSGPEQVRNLLRSLGLPEEVLPGLLDTNNWTFTAQGMEVHPPAAAVLALTPEARIRLYHTLGANAQNPDYFQPWSMKTPLFEQRLSDANVTAATRDLVRRLAYVHGRRTFFSDVPVLLGRIVDGDQRRRIMQLLNSASTHQVQLVIPRGADTDALINYWSLPGRRKDLKPILESISQLPKGGRLDIAHLLPAFARQRLYIYPSPVLAQDGVRRDCHWTSLNFAALAPDDRFGDSEQATAYILQNFSQTGEKPQYGDLLLYMLPNGDSIHSAVYLAGNLAFTKNGENLDQPWIIMDVDELRELYSHYYHSSIAVQVWRRK